jgi:DNA-binding transcriptional regulator YiaG
MPAWQYARKSLILGTGMSTAQFRAAVKRLRLSQAALARLLKVNVRTARRWASGESTVPEPIALLLACWLRGGAPVK